MRHHDIARTVLRTTHPIAAAICITVFTATLSPLRAEHAPATPSPATPAAPPAATPAAPSAATSPAAAAPTPPSAPAAASAAAPLAPSGTAAPATSVSDADFVYFYKNPSRDKLAQLMAYFNTVAQSGRRFVQPPMIGFLAAAFQKYPNDIDGLTSGDLSLPMLEIVGYSLHIAGQDAKARSISDRLKARGAPAPDFTQVPSSLDAMAAVGPTDFDMLWGASFATGDPRYCMKILARFAAVANMPGNADDLLTIAKAAGTGADLHWVVDKHGADKAHELSIIATALWAINSNAQQHEFVRKAVGEYIQAHPAEPASKTLIALARQYGRYDIAKVITLTPAGPGGAPAANVNIAYLSQILDDLARHASNYPPNFESTEDRKRAEGDVSTLSSMLDPLAEHFSHNPDLLMRLALLHAFGHNLDVPDSSKKAVAAFTALLNVVPNDPIANYRYGVFLATTTKNGEGIPYLEKAKSLGIVNSDYWLGLSYEVAGDKAKAVDNLEHYTQRVPTDENAARMLDAIRNGKVETKVVKPAP